MEKRIYFDGAANVSPYKEVIEELNKYYSEIYKNPSSIHSEGIRASFSLDIARETIANYLKCKPQEVFFVSSSSEAISWVAKMRKIIAHPTSHHSVFEAQKDCSPKLIDEPILCIPYMDSETGSILDLSEYKDKDLFLDLTASMGKIEIRLNEYPNIKYACFSAHKFGGVLGAGILFIREDVQKYNQPLIYGSQELNYRGGTENFPAIMAMKKALEISLSNQEQNVNKTKRLIDYLSQNIKKVNFRTNGVNIINITFKRLDAQSAVSLFDKNGIALSAGSACNSLSVEPSSTLLYYGYKKKDAMNTIRISLTHDNTIEECETFIKILSEIIDSFDL